MASTDRRHVYHVSSVGAFFVIIFVEAVAWSPDGTRIASGNDDWMVHVWIALWWKEHHLPDYEDGTMDMPAYLLSRCTKKHRPHS